MKKFTVFAITFLIFSTLSICKIQAQTEFTKALATCENYSKDGSITHQNEIFNILITLEKARGDKCVYKEKIYQGKNYQMLTCNFNSGQLPFLKTSMEKFTKTFPKQIAQNPIFEAKMTTNGEIFQKYLADPNYCQITHSKQK